MSDGALAERVARRCREAGLAGPGEPVTVEPLGGGVSNDVFAVRAGGREYVYKEALPKLRVEAEWLSEVTRVHREAACQRWLETILQPGEVPSVRYEDTADHFYFMDRAPRECLNWKDEMLAGRVPPEAAARAGDMLGRIHAAARGQAELREAFGDQRVFDQLRLDPYHREVARRHPELHDAVHAVAEALAAGDETLVHGDYSPKNILLAPGHNVLLDHEVVHWGDPRFDLGFFFCHLCLKALHVGAARQPLREQIPRAWEAYRARYPQVPVADWLPHLGCTLLARVDGKSPAGYLTDAEGERLRRAAPHLVRRQVTELGQALALLLETED